MSKPKNMTIDQLHAELKRLGVKTGPQTDAGPGLTTVEWAMMLGVSNGYMRLILRKAKIAGVLVNYFAASEGIDGIVRKTPHYYFKEKK